MSKPTFSEEKKQKKKKNGRGSRGRRDPFPSHRREREGKEKTVIHYAGEENRNKEFIFFATSQ